jgi:hypothetical protein
MEVMEYLEEPLVTVLQIQVAVEAETQEVLVHIIPAVAVRVLS